MGYDVKLRFQDFKQAFVKSKKYWLIYLMFISITCLTTLSQKNIMNPKFELITFILIAILGVLIISYYFAHDSEDELYKVAFVVILCFGLLCSLIVPLSDVSDEPEHFIRSEITSQGVVIPHWTGEEVGIDRLYNLTDGEKSDEYNKGIGFKTIKSSKVFSENREMTVFDIEDDTDKINNSPIIMGSAFEQNPFYGYIPQAIGILIAKLLDLNVIWMLWLGRIFNLICYSGLVSYAIKKVNHYKIPLLAVSCIPITIYQAASMSIDSMIFGLGILTVAFYINLITLESPIETKDIIIFSILTLLLGLCKLPYLAFIFLLLFIPKQNFKKEINYNLIILSCILIVALFGVLYSNYSTHALLHSWRSSYNLVNSTQQLNYFINDPLFILSFLKQCFTSELSFLANGLFNFYNGALGKHYTDNYTFITMALQLFLIIVLFTYPEKVKINFKTKIGTFIVLLLIYVGTCFIQLLTWSYVGKINLGLSVRYFIPLLALIPIIFHIDFNHSDIKKFDNYTFILIIGFLATLILSFATKYY